MTKREQAVKAVIDVLKQGDFTTKQLASKAKIPYLRKADRILEFLHNVGLVEKKDGKWVWSERKASFSSKHEYDIAMCHSELLVLSHSNESESYQGLDHMDPWAAIRLIASNFDKPNETAEGYDPAPLLMEHLKSGYEKEFWLPMLEYSALQQKHHLPVHGIAVTLYLEDLREEIPKEALFRKSGGVFAGGPQGFAPDIAARFHYREGKALYRNDFGPEEAARGVLGDKPLWSRGHPPGSPPHLWDFTGVPAFVPSAGYPDEKEAIDLIVKERGSERVKPKLEAYYKAKADYERERRKHEKNIIDLQKEIAAIPKRDIERAGEIVDALMGQVSGVIMRVRQGIPLAGVCSACPLQKIRIQG